MKKQDCSHGDEAICEGLEYAITVGKSRLVVKVGGTIKPSDANTTLQRLEEQP